MDYQIFILSKKDIKLIVIGVVVGGLLQFICARYVKNHPELLNNNNPQEIAPKTSVPHGGALVEIAGAKIIFNIGLAVAYTAKKGALMGLLSTAGLVFFKKIKIPVNALATIVRQSLPTYYSGLEKRFFIVDGDEILIDECDKSLQYLLMMLKNPDLSLDYKKEKSLKILMNHLDLETPSGKIRCLLCLIGILYVLWSADMASFMILMENLIKAVKEGKITKRLARLLIRRLLRLGVNVDPELIDAAA